MQKASVPKNESERLNALNNFGVLDTQSEIALDGLTLLASKICDSPIALISLIDENRQWFKSIVGLDVCETDRDIAFCSHAILQDDLFEVQNALEDERFFDNPLVTSGPNIRFYAGMPLKTSEGYNIGTLCVISEKPKKLNDIQRNTLEVLAKEVIAHFELNVKNKHLSELLLRIKDQQEELVIAKELAEAANVSKSKFLANMSHEIRTPLHGILNLAELGLETCIESEKDNNLECIQSSADVLVNIVNDILDFSKIEAGKLEIECIEFDLIKVIRSVAEGLRLSAQRKSIGFEVQLDTKLEKLLMGDPVRIYQIVNNLCSNAIKFTRSGKVTLHVKVVEEVTSKKEIKESQLIKISVVDTGIGIKEEVITKLFQPFHQADLSTARKYGGTGLGLSICNTLSQLMNGSLSFSSEIGVGSTFSYQQNFPISSLSEKAIVDNELVDLNQAKILIAEDNRINQTIVTKILSFNNANVVITENGKACLDHFINYGADLILMDIQMPIMDGIVATKQIRELESGKDLPIIAMTANTLKSNIDEYISIGMDGYLGKPFNKSKLNTILNIYNPKTFNHRASSLARKIGNPNLTNDEKLLNICQQTKLLVPNANRVSLWIFTNNHRAIKCLLGLDDSDKQFKNIALTESDFPTYFDFIIKNEVLSASIAREHESTKCFNQTYFEPLNIYSLLDYIFLIDGKPAGIICCERVGSVCSWSKQDEEELIRIANITTLFFAEKIINT